MEEIEITVFGRPAVRVGSIVHISFRSNRVPVLLAYLIVSTSPASRAQIVEALWPDAQPTNARQNLRQTLLYARKLLGPDAIFSEGDRLSLQAEIRSDFDHFKRIVRSLEADSGSFEVAEQLLDLLSPGFMSGYEELWMEAQRAKVISASCTAIGNFLELRIEEAPERALELLDRLIPLNPRLEFPRILKAQALRRLGRPQSAAHLGEEYSTLLQADPDEIGLLLRRKGATELKKEEERTLSIEAAVSCLIRLGEYKEAADLLVSAVSYLGTGSRGAQAIHCLDEIERSANFALSQTRRERLKVVRAELLKGLGRANESLDLMLRLLDQTKDPGVRARAHLLIARLELSLRRPDLARKNLQIGTELAKGLNMERELVKANAFAVQMEFQRGDFATCQKLGWRTVKLCQECKDVVTEIYVLSTIAQAQLRAGKSIAKTLSALAQCDLMLKEAGLPFGHLERLNIARHQEAMGELELALEGYLKGVASAEELEDRFALAIGLTYLGDLYERLGRTYESIQSHQRALLVREPLGDTLGCACSYRGIGRAELRAGHLDLARSHLIKSAELFQDVRDVNGFASALCLLALTEEAGGREEQARKVARRALDLMRRMPTGYREQMGPTFGDVIDNLEKLVPTNCESPDDQYLIESS